MISFFVFLFGFAFRIALVYIAAKLMQNKGHSAIGGVLLGMFLGWIGVVIAAVWPEKRVNVQTYAYEQPHQIEKPKADLWMHDWSEPEAVLEPIIEPAIEASQQAAEPEKSKRFCAYCECEVPKTAMYCSSCGRLLDVY